jgi:hypothetical protein
MKKLTTEDFIKRSKAKFGDRYSYADTVYDGSLVNVTISCREHGPISVRPSDHLRGDGGCRACGTMKRVSILRVDLSTFISRSRDVHGDRYDYSLSEYDGSQRNIIIVCPDHGAFSMTPQKHYRGGGCRLCEGDGYWSRARGALTTSMFVDRSRVVHGDRYDYSLSEYINSRTKLTIICSVHGEFNQAPHTHLGGAGCSGCVVPYKKMTHGGYIARAVAVHGDRYDYSKAEYTNYTSVLTIGCPIHGDFRQRAGYHLRGAGCQVCGWESIGSHTTLSTSDFIQKGRHKHGAVYDYSETEYIGSRLKLTIICPTHGRFEQRASRHLSGDYIPCPECSTENRLYNGSGVYLDVPTIVYYVRFGDAGINYYKVGITSRDVKQRFAGHAPDEVIWTHEFSTGEPAWLFEQFILHKFNDNRLNDRTIDVTPYGWTEIFGDDVASDKDSLYAEYMMEMG